ncbi:hypothetical protein [Streptomyces tunisiensis]|uniref:hypothetical protein n=1 Tax=Streptomyces tunisiensis TaxID=948699 RepID=UPI00403DFC80
MTTDRTGGAAHMLVGAGPGRRPSSGRWTASATTFPRADGPMGRWADRNRDLIALDTAELGLRLLVA